MLRSEVITMGSLMSGSKKPTKDAKAESKKAAVEEQQRLITTGLEEFRRIAKYTDIRLVCQGGRIVNANKNVLSIASGYFRTMFDKDPSSQSIINSAIEVQFPSTNAQTMELVIKYLYTGDKEEMSESADIELLEEMLQITHLIRVPSLFNFCWKLFSSDLNLDNFLDIWSLTTTYDQIETEERIVQFLVTNLDELLKHDNLLKLNEKQMETFVLSAIKTKSNDDLFAVIFKWASTEPQHLSRHVLQLLVIVDLTKISNTCMHRVLFDEPVSKISVFFDQLYEKTGLLKLCPHLMQLFLKCATSSKPTEQLISIIIKWTRDKPNDRIGQILQLLRMIDLDDVSGEFLHQLITNETLLKLHAPLNDFFLKESVARLRRPAGADKLTGPGGGPPGGSNPRKKNCWTKLYFVKFEGGGNNEIVFQFLDLKQKRWSDESTMTLLVNVETAAAAAGSAILPAVTTKSVFCFNDNLYWLSVCHRKLSAHNLTSGVFVDCVRTRTAQSLIDVHKQVLFKNCAYVYDGKTFAKFDFNANSLTELTVPMPPNAELGAGNSCELLATSQEIFLWVCNKTDRRKKTLYSFNPEQMNLSWKDLGTRMSRDRDRKLAQSQNQNSAVCQGKLCFISETLIQIFDPAMNTWGEKKCPQMEGKCHVSLCCDQPFLLWSDDRRQFGTRFWIHHLTSDQWEELPSGFNLSNWDYCAINLKCDIYF